MTLSVHAMATESFAPMLESLSDLLDKGAQHAREDGPDLVDARLAPDMYTLAQQVQQACHYTSDGVARLAGQPPAAMDTVRATVEDLKAQIARTLDRVRAIPIANFAQAEARDCSITLPGAQVIEMDGVRFLRAWALPHFYFHVVTAYDILRHCGVPIGKKDYLSQVGGFIRRKAT